MNSSTFCELWLNMKIFVNAQYQYICKLYKKMMVFHPALLGLLLKLSDSKTNSSNI